jgi:hypothetical protein
VKKLSISGILLGGIVDVLSTSILAAPIFLYVVFRYGAVHGPKMLHESLLLAMGQWLIGVFGSVLGGYVAAWMAGHDEVLNAALSAYLGIGVAIVSWIASASAISTPERLLEVALAPLFAAVGGYLKLNLKRSKRGQIRTAG